jgi:hypothetical protein
MLASGAARAAPGIVLSASVVPGEIVFPGVEITILSTVPLDAETAGSAIGIVRITDGDPSPVAGVVTLRAGRRAAAWSPVAPLAPGQYRLVLHTPGRTRPPTTGWDVRIPFVVTDSKASIEKLEKVEHMVRVRLVGPRLHRLPPFAADPEQPPREYFELFKLSHRQTGQPRLAAFDQQGAAMGVAQLRATIRTARFGPSGKVHPDLRAVMDDPAGPDEIAVAIWLDWSGLIDGTSGVEGYLDKLLELHDVFLGAAAAAVDGWWGLPDPVLPVVFAKIDDDRIAAVAALEEVLGVFPHDSLGVVDETPGYRELARSERVHARGVKGTGVRVAVWERGPAKHDDVPVDGSFDALRSILTTLEPFLPVGVLEAIESGIDLLEQVGLEAVKEILESVGIPTGELLAPTYTDHSLWVHALIRHADGGGHAPGCRLYSADRMWLSALLWAVKEERCTVVNQSFHRGREEISPEVSFDDLYKDWLVAYRSEVGAEGPRPTIVQAAGNLDPPPSGESQSPPPEYVNHKGHGGLVVGGFSINPIRIAASSAWMNPASPHGDRELPHLCAQSTDLELLGGAPPAGTSFAAPAVAGIAALVQETDPELQQRPEACRAIILAGAERIDPATTWWEDVATATDAREGAGAVDALRSYRIAKRRRPPGIASSYGWDAGEIDDASLDDTGQTTAGHEIRIPGALPFHFAPTRVRVVLAWNATISAVDTTGGLPLPPFLMGELDQDLDLRVFDAAGHLVARSASFDNSVEIAEFEGWPGARYTVRTRRRSGTGKARFGLAWIVLGGTYWSSVSVKEEEEDPRRSILDRWRSQFRRRRRG